MKRPTAASLKKVTPDNLAALGAERLARILVEAAETRPDLKRRLRMELAAEQGPEHLVTEIDKRLGSLETSRGRIGWRQRPAFVRDLDALRVLVADRLAVLDRAAALERLWRFMDTARPIGRRLKDRDGAAGAVFARAASNLGRLLAAHDHNLAAHALVEALARQGSAWAEWLPALLAQAPAPLAGRALALMEGAGPGGLALVRHLADAANDVDAYRSTYPAAAARTPEIAAGIARRLLAADRAEEAGAVLRAAAPKSSAVDFDWEGAWIDYLDRAGRADDAQAVRWASFERTLSVDRARDFTRRLDDFDDVEAEARAFAHAAGHPDFEAGLRFLMDWPALVEAGRMIQARPDEVTTGAEAAEAWAARLRGRYPAAAHLLLRKAAHQALRRRDFKTCDRLTQEADAISL